MPGRDQVEATGWAAELELLAGGSWMALSAGEVALRGASHYLAIPRRCASARSGWLGSGPRRSASCTASRATITPTARCCTGSTRRSSPAGCSACPDEVTACVFDLDSVLTTSTGVHIAAWADTFDSFLLARAARLREPFVPFDRDRDYRGLRRRTAAPGGRARVPEPAAASGWRRVAQTTPPDAETVHGLANRKEQALERHLARDGVAAYVGSRCYLEAAHLVGISRAVVTSSANTTEILERAGLAHLVDQRVDAATIAAERLASKPAPDTLIAACELLGRRARAGGRLRDDAGRHRRCPARPGSGL